MATSKRKSSVQADDAFQLFGSPKSDEFREILNDVFVNSGLSRTVSNEDADDEIESAVFSKNFAANAPVNNQLLEEVSSSLTKYAPEAANTLNNTAQQLSIFYENVVTVPSDTDEENQTQFECDDVQNIQPQCTVAQTVPNTSNNLCSSNQPKRHIMISYNRSSRETCKKIYEGLVGRNYKVWMDLTDMFDDILVGMARAIENSYIVLLCINQQYYQSEYCRLEAEYAAENRVKFIPCLMEKEFRAESWLGIIKGSNVHIDFSSIDEFDQSFEDLIRQINYIEQKLDLHPRVTPGPCSMTNPMESQPFHSTVNSSVEMNARRFDEIIRRYKESIHKQDHRLNSLKRNELSELIVKLRQELFSEPDTTLSDDEHCEDNEKQNSNEQILQDLVSRSLQQNQLLLNVVDRLSTQNAQIQNRQNLDVDGIIKVIIAILLLWTLNVLCQKELNS